MSPVLRNGIRSRSATTARASESDRPATAAITSAEAVLKFTVVGPLSTTMYGASRGATAGSTPGIRATSSGNTSGSGWAGCAGCALVAGTPAGVATVGAAVWATYSAIRSAVGCGNDSSEARLDST